MRRRDFLRNSLAGLAAALASGALPASALADALIKDAAVSVNDPAWTRNAIRLLWDERRRAGVTPLIKLVAPFNDKLCLYLKNEGLSPTASLKHRVAWGLIMAALVNGEIGPNTSLFEATSGNTGIGEAYFAKLLGLPFTAVMRPGISPLKMQAIRDFGGQNAVAAAGVAPATYLEELRAKEPNGYNLSQFANTEKSLDYFDAAPALTMNMAAEIFRQLEGGSHPCPRWFVAGAGSGGTATSIGRYLRKWADLSGRDCPAQLAVVDPEDSALFDWYRNNDATVTAKSSRVEGIGSSGPGVFGKTFSLLRAVVSRMLKVPDDASIAGMRLVANLTGFEPGPSSGTNLVGAFRLLEEMHRKGESGAVVTIICDDGKRYRDSYYDAAWLKGKELNQERWKPALETFWRTGKWSEPTT